MIEPASISRKILNLKRDEKLRLMSGVIMELTLAARYESSEPLPQVAAIMEKIEAIHRVCGYMTLVIENTRLDSEDLLAETLSSVIQSVPAQGMRNLIARYFPSSAGP